MVKAAIDNTTFLYQAFRISTEFKPYLDKTVMLQRRLLTGSGHPPCGRESVACKPPSETEVISSSLLKVRSADQIMERRFMIGQLKMVYSLSPLSLR